MTPASQQTNTLPLEDICMMDTVLIERASLDTVLIKHPDVRPEKPKTKETEIYNYQMFISLEDEGFPADSHVFFEVSIACFTKRKLSVNDVIAFDFLALAEDARKKGDKKTAKALKKIRKKHHRVVSVKKYTIVGSWLPNIFFIRPLPPPKAIFFGALKKSDS